MADLKPGETAHILNSDGRCVATISRREDVYSCTCRIWRHRTGSVPENQRSCKHLESYRGKQIELCRVNVSRRQNQGESIPNWYLPENVPRVLSNARGIRKEIERISDARRLWLSTKLNDIYCMNRTVSIVAAMIDVPSTHPCDVVILDLQDKAKLVQLFNEKVINDGAINKVFHQASSHITFLGSCNAANVSCTFSMARDLKHSVYLPDLSLRGLARHFGLLRYVESNLQKSDRWASRPLAHELCYYAAKEINYLGGGPCETAARTVSSPMKKRLLL